MPPEHEEPAPQTLPHIPQLLLSVLVLTSHPSAALPLQLPKPLLQLPTPQIPPEQPGVPLATGGQTMPQPPQWLVLVLVLTSHPSPGAKLQSANPVRHP